MTIENAVEGLGEDERHWLAALAAERRIDWSDSWSNDDLNEFRAASLRRLDAEEAEGMLL